MSRRMSAHVIKRIPCDGGDSPLNFFPQITVEMKAFWPPFTVPPEEVDEIIDQAVAEFKAQMWITAAAAENYPRNIWLTD